MNGAVFSSIKAPPGKIDPHIEFGGGSSMGRVQPNRFYKIQKDTEDVAWHSRLFIGYHELFQHQNDASWGTCGFRRYLNSAL